MVDKRWTGLVGDVFLSILILHCVVRVIVFSRLLCNDVIVCAHYFTIYIMVVYIQRPLRCRKGVLGSSPTYMYAYLFILIFSRIFSWD